MNTKKLTYLGLTLAILFTCHSAAYAALQGAQVNLSTISPCPSFCGGEGGVSEFASDGSSGRAFASVDLSNSDGDASGRASLSGELLLPILGSNAFSNDNSRVEALATGMKSYDYQGAATTTIDLNFTFDGIASAPNPSDARAAASIVVMKSRDFPFSTDYATLVFELIDLDPSIELVGNERLFLPVNDGQQSLLGSVSIELDPGDRIAVWGQVQTRGTRGGSADALNTLTSSFSDTTDLVPVVVPSPSSLVLLSLALGSLCATRRSFRSSKIIC